MVFTFAENNYKRFFFVQRPTPQLAALTNPGPLAELTDMATDDYDLTDSFPSYPFFPMETDPLYHFLDNCVHAMEEWVYTQGFWGRSFYTVPDGISHITFEKIEKRKKNYTSCVPPFIQLLINLVGDQMRDYLELE